MIWGKTIMVMTMKGGRLKEPIQVAMLNVPFY